MRRVVEHGIVEVLHDDGGYRGDRSAVRSGAAAEQIKVRLAMRVVLF